MKKKIYKIITLIIIAVLSVTLFAACSEGVAGPRGEQGLQGIQGKQGPDGKDGAAGANGSSGVDGKDGKEGKDGVGGTVKPDDYYDNPFDYYVQTYGVDYDHVFKTLVAPDLDLLLSGFGAASQLNADPTTTRLTHAGTKGKFAILFGGAHDGYTAAMMQTVNASAKEKGVETVWVLDTHYDGRIGETLAPLGNITQSDINALSGQFELGRNSNVDATSSANPGVGYRLSGTNGLIGHFDNTGANKATDVLRDGSTDTSPAQTALLFVIDVPDAEGAERTDDAKKPKIIDYYINTEYASGEEIANDIFFNPKKFADFKKDIGDVLEAVGGDEGFFDPYVLRPGRTRLYDIKDVGGIDDFDGVNKYFQTVNFAELTALLEHPGDHFVFFAAFGCPNALALYRPLYEQASLADFQGKIYVFDATLINTSGTGEVNIRSNSTDTNFRPRLWAHLFDTYLAGFESRHNIASANQGTNGHFQAAANRTTSNAGAVAIGGIAYGRMVLPTFLLYNNEVGGNVVSESKAGTHVSKGGIVDIFEVELQYRQNASTGTAVADSADREYAYRYFDLMFQKYGVAHDFIANGYTVQALRNAVRQNAAIRKDFTPAIGLIQTSPAPTLLDPYVSSGTLAESGFGLNVLISATKGGENINIIYNYFADETAITVRRSANGSGVRQTVFDSYIVNGEHKAGTLAALGTAANQEDDAVYFGTKGAIAILQNTLLRL